MVLYDPQPELIIESAARRGLTLSLDEANQLLGLGQGLLRGSERLAHAEAFTLPTRHPRLPGWTPDPADNELGAWAWRCDISGSPAGLLTDRTIVLKDIIPIAGMPMSGGSAILQGHVSGFDATVTTRVLDAGGRIVGVGATEDLCLSGASVSAVTGQVRNPRDPLRSAGGSSSGVAALIASGTVDAGIGADQGGSIRIPSSLTGIFGLKPTYGLVPYTGAAPIDVSLDHLGPMAATVENVARLLQSIAGFDDGLDPRQRTEVVADDYLSAIADADVTGLRIGVLTEGFGEDSNGIGDAGIDATVRDAVAELEARGAIVTTVSVPQHALAMDMHGALLLQGASEFMIRGNGTGLPGKGFYDEGIGQASAAGMALHGDQLFASVKYAIAMGGYLWDAYGGAYYARAQNLAVQLRRSYDAVFAGSDVEGVDVIVMPTTRKQAPLLPTEPVPGLDAVDLALDPGLIGNTCAFNHTGHPALNVPIGPLNGLPVGMMLVGAWYSEATLLRVARVLEAAGKTLPTTAG